MEVSIRRESPADTDSIRRVNVQAFGRSSEADLVERLHAEGAVAVSLVAEFDGRVVGHILFSPVRIGDCHATALALGPMCVVPEHQRSGFGSRLVAAGLDACRSVGASAVVVLGHPTFYPRFGFRPASVFGIDSTYHVPDPVFMALELRRGALDGCGGTARYHPAFDLM